MALRESDPESYITEYTLAYEDNDAFVGTGMSRGGRRYVPPISQRSHHLPDLKKVWLQWYLAHKKQPSLLGPP